MSRIVFLVEEGQVARAAADVGCGLLLHANGKKAAMLFDTTCGLILFLLLRLRPASTVVISKRDVLFIYFSDMPSYSSHLRMLEHADAATRTYVNHVCA